MGGHRGGCGCASHALLDPAHRFYLNLLATDEIVDVIDSTGDAPVFGGSPRRVTNSLNRRHNRRNELSGRDRQDGCIRSLASRNQGVVEAR
jgi:hypothetical protein